MFLSYIERNERPLNFGQANLQKYFFNIQWHKEKTFKDLLILLQRLEHNENQSNIIDKQYSCLCLIIFST